MKCAAASSVTYSVKWADIISYQSLGPAAATEAGTIRGYEGTRPTTTTCAGELTILRNIYMMETNHLYAQSTAGTFHKQMDNTHMEVAVEYLD